MTHDCKTGDHPPSLFPGLQSPVSDTRPCGDNLEYEPAFVLLQARISPRDTVQYGDFVAVPDPLNWSEIERDCHGLLVRTRDIRLLALLIRCQCRLRQATGLRDGLACLYTLLTRYPVQLHPQLEVDGERDPALRANALTALADREGLLADVRDLVLGDRVLRLRVRDIERALALPRPAGALAPDTVRQQLGALREHYGGQMTAMDEACEQAMAIQRWCDDTMPDASPDLGPLVRLLQLACGRAPASRDSSELRDPPVPPAEVDDGMATDAADAARPTPSPAAPAAPTDRAAVLQQIRAARQWFEDYEPSSPVTLLLRQAERLIGKPFAEVFQAIPTELVEHWSRAED